MLSQSRIWQQRQRRWRTSKEDATLWRRPCQCTNVIYTLYPLPGHDICVCAVYDGKDKTYDSKCKTIFTCNRFVGYNCYYMVAYETVRELRNRRHRHRHRCCLGPVIAATTIKQNARREQMRTAKWTSCRDFGTIYRNVIRWLVMVCVGVCLCVCVHFQVVLTKLASFFNHFFSVCHFRLRREMARRTYVQRWRWCTVCDNPETFFPLEHAVRHLIRIYRIASRLVAIGSFPSKWARCGARED